MRVGGPELGNHLLLDVKTPSKQIDWREAWRPAFDRILTSIAIANNITRP
ncbi:MAG: hypothetical protein ACTHKS_12545 [Gaiellaceae bacterium]